MCGRSIFGRLAAVVVLGLAPGRAALAQGAPGLTARLSMDEAVRLALDRNQTLRAARLTIDESKADEITAALKPNVNLSFGVQGLSAFSPSQFTFSTVTSNATYNVGLGYTFERGGKREKRVTVAEDTTDVTAKGVLDTE